MLNAKFPHECDVDYVNELIEYTLLQLHQTGECGRFPKQPCQYCEDERSAESAEVEQ